MAETRSEREALEKPSLVSVRANKASSASPRPEESSPAIDLGIGMSPGTRLRARLESAASTAVQTPVVAVVEYNYEQNGEIVVPAGAKVFGRLEAADRSGYIGVRFDSMMLPDGSSVRIEAAATDLELRPFRAAVIPCICFSCVLCGEGFSVRLRCAVDQRSWTGPPGRSCANKLAATLRMLRKA